jgi:excisionase family DNA binding protein
VSVDTDTTEESKEAANAEGVVWLGTRKAADWLGVTLRTLYRLIDDGQITAYQVGRVIRVQESDLKKFLERSRIQPGSLAHLHPEPKAASSERD